MCILNLNNSLSLSSSHFKYIKYFHLILKRLIMIEIRIYVTISAKFKTARVTFKR